MNNNLYNGQIFPVTQVTIGNINFYQVIVSSALEKNLNELNRLYLKFDDLLSMNMTLKMDAIEVNSYLRAIYSDIEENHKGNENKLLDLFKTAMLFVETYRKSTNLNERDEILALIAPIVKEIYERHYAPRLDSDFYFELKLYCLLERDNMVATHRTQRPLHPRDVKDLYDNNELDKFLLDNKWKVIKFLRGLNEGYNGGYFFKNPLDNSYYNVAWDMSAQISGLSFVDVN
ncbi:hypothetical protein [Acinetobacter venetianus]|uniref:hypothetical protein n=1 Tax=Acinetobacter venetianus TaxID=52133 RepID=UPI00215000B9|nr:hypothetical protein [Acinetobacter venetianus]MCR4529793.1 hypothetical protein [Acinetobacter venetianus]